MLDLNCIFAGTLENHDQLVYQGSNRYVVTYDNHFRHYVVTVYHLDDDGEDIKDAPPVTFAAGTLSSAIQTIENAEANGIEE